MGKKLLIILFVEISIIAAGFGVERMFPQWSSISWFVVTATALIMAAVIWIWPAHWTLRLLNTTRDTDQWIPIADAVDHIVEEYESYRIIGDEQNSRLHAFKDIHDLMCKGKVKVRGALHKSSEKSKQLSRKLCCKLKPIIAGTAIGPVYNLLNPEPNPPATKIEGAHGAGEVRWEGQGIYDDLRIRSRDIQKSWPDAAKQIDQSISEEEKGPTKRQVKEWLEFIEKYELDWKTDRLNILYETTWGEMRPFLQEDTIEASLQRQMAWDFYLIRSGKPLKDAINSQHFKSLVKRDLLALLQQRF